MNQHDRHTCSAREVLLLFPPLTEARLFPYLSLPMLSAYLEAHGVRVACRDLNLELIHRLFSGDHFASYVKAAHARHDASSLRTNYRVAMAEYLMDHGPDVARAVFAPSSSPDTCGDQEIRAVNQGVELLLEQSLLKAQIESLEEIDQAVSEHGRRQYGDLGTRLLHQLILDALGPHYPSVIGISIPFYSQLLPSLLLASWVKETNPSVIMVLGGQQVMLRNADLRELASIRRYVDILGVGPGEQTLLALIRSCGRWQRSSIPDAVFPKEPDNLAPLRSTVHIREVPPPNFRDFPIHSYVNKETQLPLITCVGCSWGHCVFCSYGNRSRRLGYQQKSPRQIADECEYLVSQYGVRRINFVDENTNLKLVLVAMRELRQRGVSIEYSTRNRFEAVLLDPTFCAELADLGCVLMSVGYETNSQRLIDRLDKGVQVSHYQPIIDNLHEVGITLRLSIMGGILDETESEVAATEAFLRRNADKVGIDVMQMMVAEPGTHLGENLDRFGLRLVSQTQLRGNPRVNYGMGRMGFRFDYPDGDTYGSRLDRFVKLHEIVPAKNVEVPPAARAGARTDRCCPLATLRLHPWVRVVQAASNDGMNQINRYLADVVFETVCTLPDSIRVEDGHLVAAEDKAQHYLGRLASIGFGDGGTIHSR